MFRRIPFWAQILAGLGIGVVLGLIAHSADVTWLTSTLDHIGTIFVQLLKLAVPILVFTAIVVSISGLRKVEGAAKLALNTLVWFMITAAIAVGIGIAIGLITKPGSGVDGSKLVDSSNEITHSGGWLDFLTGIIPTNPVAAFADGKVLQIVFLAVVVGAAASSIGPKAEPILALSRSVLELVQKALWWVIRLSPIGTAGLVGTAVATYGTDTLAPLGVFAADVYLGCALVLFVVYPLVLRFAGGLSPIRFFRGAWPALELAFVSRSSVGTMPVTQKVTEGLGVPRDYASFAVPFGATTKMDGCAAIYPALAAIFTAQFFGIHLHIQDYLLIALVSVVGSAATAGVTGAIVMLTLTLSTLGLPLAGAGLLLSIDPILDMMRTLTNVAGQSLVPIVVSARAGILDREAYSHGDGAGIVTEDPELLDATVAATPAGPDEQSDRDPDKVPVPV